MRRYSFVRAATVAVAAGGALLAPAAVAFADSSSTLSDRATPKNPTSAKESGVQDKGVKDQAGSKGDDLDKQVARKGSDEPGDKRVYVRIARLDSGWTAKIYKVGNGYDADMIRELPNTGKPGVWDTLKQRGNVPAYGQDNGTHFVLQPDGTMTSWVEGGHKGRVENDDKSKKVAPSTGARKVTPTGGVKAGVEESGDGSGLHVAASGGMAAAGAAGLGFVALRRRRVDG